MHFPLPVVTSFIMLFILSVMLWRAYRKKFSSMGSWLLFFSGSAAVFIFIFFAGTWAFLSYHLRWVFLFLFVIGISYSFLKHKHLPFRSQLPISVWFAVGRTFVLLAGLALCALFADSKTYNGEATELTFPFKDGRFYMMQGGSNRLSNFFHSYFSRRGHGYAMDIAELNDYGNRAKSFFADDLEQYEIYNDTVYSPAGGKIIWLEDDVEENLPGDINVVQIHGNHIVIQADGYRVFMAHLKAGTFQVKMGDIVKAGQPIAVLGNAGFTVEPHLHLNVLKDYPKDKYDKGLSSPATFKGRFYTLNDVIIN